MPDEARGVFSSDALPRVVLYAEALAGRGVERGLIGPREVPRLWVRHLLNCGVVGERVDHGARVADVGTGAGLPGLVLALARPDLQMTLVEPLLRRVRFLDEIVGELGATNVEVVRARAEELHGAREFDVVVSRAVAPLGRLARWCLPLVADSGVMLAMKGESARDEVQAARAELDQSGAASVEVLLAGGDVISPPCTLVRVVPGRRGSLQSRSADAGPRRGTRARRGSSAARRPR